jgi:hypothetical protein
MPNVNLKVIGFQYDVRSRPHRDNYGELQDKVNDLQHQWDVAMAPLSSSEVVNARDYHDVVRDRIRALSSALRKNVLITGGAVTPHGGGTMQVDVSAGQAVVDGVGCNWLADISSAIPTVSGVGNTRYDLVLSNSDNTLSVLGGVEAATPKPPIVSAQKVLALVKIIYGQTSIAAGDIFTPIDNAVRVGGAIWIVERAPEMLVRAADSDTDDSVYLPYSAIKAGDRVRIEADRRQFYATTPKRRMAVFTMFGGSWVEINRIYEGGLEIVANIDDPANPVDWHIARRFERPYRAIASGTTSGTAQDTIIPLATIEYQDYVNGSGWAVAYTGQWRAPQDGHVRVEYWARTSAALHVYISKNGGTSSWQSTRVPTAFSGNYYHHGCFVIQVAKGDTIDLRPGDATTDCVGRCHISYTDLW